MRRRERARWTTARGARWASAACAVALGALAACVGEDAAVVIAPPPGSVDAAPGTGPGEVDGGDGAPAIPADEAGTDAGLDASDRFCSKQPPGAGATDFFCADFDGPDLTEGFIPNVPDGGSLIRVSDVAYSAPSSLATQGNATVVWEKVGAVNVSAVELTARVNAGALVGVPPPKSGSMTILELEVPGTRIGVAYTRGTILDGDVDYTGYFLYSMRCAPPCSSTEQRLPSFPANTWSLLQLRWETSGAVEITIDGAPLRFDNTLYGATGSKVSMKLGLRAVGEAPATPRHAFDDVMVSVER